MSDASMRLPAVDWASVAWFVVGSVLVTILALALLEVARRRGWIRRLPQDVIADRLSPPAAPPAA